MSVRYSQDAKLELQQIERTIASNRKTAQNNPNPKSTAIADATLPSLQRKRDAVIAELAAGLPDRPANPYASSADWKGTTPPSFPACCIGTNRVLSDEENASLEIPAFLKRDKLNRLPTHTDYGKATL